MTLAECGAQAHALGYCRPCKYLAKYGSCRQGTACRFCHEAHEAVSAPLRPNKATRERCKRLVQKHDMQALLDDVARGVVEMAAEPPEGSHKSARDQYARAILRASLRSQVEEGSVALAAAPPNLDAPMTIESVEGTYAL
eukprot:NODE_18388_length_895_cov_5.955729.p2 GENE.NODE_18388_length_895_cov_5.955729~~NODE_18388_length_895_cov_5.955729.p2  ORF type:complete len:140 (+),score=19.08 NODE_18388_length_895_cov_5.955729:387-806(+)